MTDYNSTVILSAFLLDLIFGDPQWRWHPIRIIGKLIEMLDKKLNRGNDNKVFKGLIMVILAVGIVISFVWLSLELAKAIHPIFHFILSVLFVYFALSLKSLGVEAKKVYCALAKKDIQTARNNLSMIVARDTQNLEDTEIIRATVETVSESTMDGIIAPLFYAFLGGSPLANLAFGGPVLVWAYKTINTLDSMIGYQSERYAEFGKISAKLDAIVNFIPAKITCIFVSISSMLCRKNFIRSFKWTMKYLFKGSNKNSEAVEAAMAGSLNIQLGGLNFYNSIAVNKPLIGDKVCELNLRHIGESIKISYISSALFLLLNMLLKYVAKIAF